MEADDLPTQLPSAPALIYTPASFWFLILTAGDINGDGNLDIYLTEWSGGAYDTILLGDGQGNFTAQAVSTQYQSIYQIYLADFNGDGVLDRARRTGGVGLETAFGSGQPTRFTQRFDLTTREGALASIPLIDEALARTSNELGAVGAIQSRLLAALNSISARRNNYAQAESRIKDSDIASDSATLIKLKILEQAAGAILAQANQAPEIALRLLKEAGLP